MRVYKSLARMASFSQIPDVAVYEVSISSLSRELMDLACRHDRHTPHPPEGRRSVPLDEEKFKTEALFETIKLRPKLEPLCKALAEVSRTAVVASTLPGIGKPTSSPSSGTPPPVGSTFSSG
jgi:hypothetical protein